MSNAIMPTTLSEEDFDKRFIIKEFPHGDKFETYGEELELFNKEAALNPNNVWTCLDGEAGELIFVNRIAFVNRIYYFITEEAYTDSEDLAVEINIDFD